MLTRRTTLSMLTASTAILLAPPVLAMEPPIYAEGGIAIDSIAAEGVRFTQAYAHTVCCPSRAALMTGRHPQRGGVRHWTQGNMNGPDGINMALSEVTIAEVLSDMFVRRSIIQDCLQRER